MFQKIWKCWIRKDHDFEIDYEAPRLNGKCRRCSARLRGRPGAHPLWQRLYPAGRKIAFVPPEYDGVSWRRSAEPS